MWTAILIVLVLLLSISLYLRKFRRPKNFPPGPSWLPVVGNFPDLKKECREKRFMHDAIASLAKAHNTKVLGLRLGTDLTIVVFGHDLVKEVFTKEEYDGRPDSFFIRLRAMGGRTGITFTDGRVWMEQRSFAVKHLRQLGFGKDLMETMIMDELQDLIKLFTEQEGTAISMGLSFAPSVLNVLWYLTTGRSFSSRDDPRLHRLLKALKDRSKAFDMAGGTLNQFPWLRYFAPEKTGYNLILRLNSDLIDIFMTSIKEHQELYSPDKPQDLIDAFLNEMRAQKSEDSTFTVEQLIMVCMDFFIAGAQTTSTTLDFVFLMLLLNPDVQRRAYTDLVSVVGYDRLPTVGDRSKLPYLEAVLMEVQRMYQVTPVAGPRRVTRDTKLNGYDIPKDTTVLMSLWSVHYDKEHWGDPEVFRPERHINEKGELISEGDWLLPFGLGRRRCLGEALARSCTFLFFAGIIQQFEVLPVPGKELPGKEPVPGLTLSPQPYKVCLRQRASL